MRLIALLALLGVLMVGAVSEPGKSDIVRVTIKTELGNIDLELYPNKAPITVANFLKYVDRGSYKNGVVHRTVTMDNQPTNKIKIEVIQGDETRRTKKRILPRLP